MKRVGRGLIYVIIEWKVPYKKCAQNSVLKSYWKVPLKFHTLILLECGFRKVRSGFNSEF